MIYFFSFSFKKNKNYSLKIVQKLRLIKYSFNKKEEMGGGKRRDGMVFHLHRREPNIIFQLFLSSNFPFHIRIKKFFLIIVCNIISISLHVLSVTKIVSDWSEKLNKKKICKINILN